MAMAGGPAAGAGARERRGLWAASTCRRPSIDQATGKWCTRRVVHRVSRPKGSGGDCPTAWHQLVETCLTAINGPIGHGSSPPCTIPIPSNLLPCPSGSRMASFVQAPRAAALQRTACFVAVRPGAGKAGYVSSSGSSSSSSRAGSAACRRSAACRPPRRASAVVAAAAATDEGASPGDYVECHYRRVPGWWCTRVSGPGAAREAAAPASCVTRAPPTCMHAHSPTPPAASWRSILSPDGQVFDSSRNEGGRQVRLRASAGAAAASQRARGGAPSLGGRSKRRRCWSALACPPTRRPSSSWAPPTLFPASTRRAGAGQPRPAAAAAAERAAGRGARGAAAAPPPCSLQHPARSVTRPTTPTHHRIAPCAGGGRAEGGRVPADGGPCRRRLR